MAQNNPAKDIRDKLIADGVTTPLFISSEPKTPNAVITLYNTSEYEPPSPRFLLDFSTLQIRSRANNYETAYNNLLEIFNLLVGSPPFTQNTTIYTGIIAMTNIFEIGRDDNDRRILAFNLRMFVEPASDGQHRRSI